MARPTKYNKTYAERVSDYLAEKEKGKLLASGKTIHGLPSIANYCAYVNIHVDTANEWEKRHPEFSEALDKIRERQHEKLIEYGLSKEFDSGLTKLILSKNHGYVEQTENRNVGMTYAEWCEQQKIK